MYYGYATNIKVFNIESMIKMEPLLFSIFFVSLLF